MILARSSRSIRLCTVVRDKPRLRASAAVDSRAFSRSKARSFWSTGSRATGRGFIRCDGCFDCSGFGARPKRRRGSADRRNIARPSALWQYRSVRAFSTMRPMKHIVVAGAGKIGVTIADMLAASGDYRVTLADKVVRRSEGLHPSITPTEVDVTDPKS